ncbi:hypothetical protein KIW84_022958 [Lathyrus oleraceus]|uniref:Aminotransferase-like plant mobile domain-containing protein n=1 Tax=Pisum sativum TaxID=3888 RepID=A0A9D5BBJ7_PEA|nr:hypothetical protein KIW84_022958 [Pisum sativum]
MLVSLATHLYEQRKVFLNKLILYGLYESLGTSSCNIIERPYLNSLQIGGPIWLLLLWLDATFVPTLCSDTPSSMTVGVKGARLSHITLNDGDIVFPDNFKKYTSMLYKSKALVSTMAPFLARQCGPTWFCEPFPSPTIEGQSDQGESDIFDGDEFSSLPRPFPLKYMITREIHYALSEVGQCSKASKVVLPENPGHLKGSGASRVRIKHVLAFDTNNEVEAEDTPLKGRRGIRNNSTPDPGHASSSLSLDDIKSTTRDLGESSLHDDCSCYGIISQFVRELAFKLGRLEIPASIYAFAIDLEILIDQSVLVTKLKRSPSSLFEEKPSALSQQQDIVSQSKKRLAQWEARTHDKNYLIALDSNIQT